MFASPRSSVTALLPPLSFPGRQPPCVAGGQVAQRLGDWLDWREAIGLFDLLQQAEAPLPTGPATARPPSVAALGAELGALRDELMASLADDPIFTDPAAGIAAARSQHAAWQQRFELRLAPLRERLREALRVRSPALARLAALDALMQRALAAKERQCLAAVPGLLEADAANTDPASALPRLTASLQAELNLRLLPLDGLLAALRDAEEAGR